VREKLNFKFKGMIWMKSVDFEGVLTGVLIFAGEALEAGTGLLAVFLD
jgi:hypothetical protein